jgi:hypothetical protein
MRYRRQQVHERLGKDNEAITSVVANSERVGVTVDSGRWFGSRDWHRRCVYLAQRVESDTFHLVEWSDYSHRTIWRMWGYMEHMPRLPRFTSETRQLILSQLRSLTLLTAMPTKRVTKSRVIVRVEWTTRGMRKVRLKRILMDRTLKQLLPGRARDMWSDDIMVVTKLIKPIRRTVLNHTKTARNLSVPNPTRDCPCRRLFPLRFRPNGGCVRTGELDIVSNAKLRELFSYGPNFRDYIDGDGVKAVSLGLDELIARMADL